MEKINDIRIKGLRTLAVVIERGTLSKAAQQLNLTPSAVSKQITRLEEDLGVRLLERSTRRVKPTAAGLAIHDQARPLLEGLVDTLNAIVTDDAEVRGVVRISATPAYGNARLIPILARLARDHPHLGFDLKFTERLLDFIEDEVDVAIREGKLSDSSHYARRIGMSAVKLFAAPSYLQNRDTIKSLDDLVYHDLISVPVRDLSNDVSRWKGLDGRMLNLSPRFIVNDLFAVRDLALTGAGVAGLPDYVAEEYIKDGRLVHCLPEFAPIELPVHALYPSKRYVPRRVQVLLDALAAQAGSEFE